MHKTKLLYSIDRLMYLIKTDGEDGKKLDRYGWDVKLDAFVHMIYIFAALYISLAIVLHRMH